MLSNESPKAKTPHEREFLERTIAATDRRIDRLVCKLTGKLATIEEET